MPDRLLYRPTRAEINLAAVKRNLERVAAFAGPARVLFVVKADAYGHGAVPLALYCQEGRLCHSFGVACLEEGLELRAAGVKLPLLVLGSLYPFNSFMEAIKNDLTVTISSMDAARQVLEAARLAGKKALCHIKVETGMNRIGARRPSAVKIFQELSGQPEASVEGVYTHLSSADTDPEYTAQQLAYFRETLAGLGRSGARDLARHAANSYAAVHVPDSRWDMVRSGLAVYGCMDGFEPALSLKTRIVFIKNVREGAFISYNKSFRAPSPMKVATVPIGYGDGYLRALSNKAEMLVGGRRCRVLGNVTMDMVMLDVTAVERVSVGDEVVAIGRQGAETVTAEELAGLAGTIPYEITTLLTRRVPRVHS